MVSCAPSGIKARPEGDPIGHGSLRTGQLTIGGMAPSAGVVHDVRTHDRVLSPWEGRALGEEAK